MEKVFEGRWSKTEIARKNIFPKYLTSKIMKKQCKIDF